MLSIVDYALSSFKQGTYLYKKRRIQVSTMVQATIHNLVMLTKLANIFLSNVKLDV